MWTPGTFSSSLWGGLRTRLMLPRHPVMLPIVSLMLPIVPLSANMVLRNFGLTVFLAQVGIASGPQFAATVAESGFTLLLLGAIIMLALIVVTMIAGRLLAIPADDLFGIVSV